MSSSSELILGLFFADENKLIYDKTKYSDTLSSEEKEKLQLLSYKFLGPVFMTEDRNLKDNWNIELIESTLSLTNNDKITSQDIIQSFFSLNSTITTEQGTTNLFSLIGSPYTEDIYNIYRKMVQYIHPCIVKGKKMISEMKEGDINPKDLVNEELKRGINLIDYNLRKSRKMYWQKRKKFKCLGIIERKIEKGEKETLLYTFSNDTIQKEGYLEFLPSFYVMVILPNFYENLITQTLRLFGKENVIPNVRRIKLRNNNKITHYIEEFSKSNGVKRSCGAILTEREHNKSDFKSLPYYKKHLRSILDKNLKVAERLNQINPSLENKKWSATSEQDLQKIHVKLDNN